MSYAFGGAKNIVHILKSFLNTVPSEIDIYFVNFSHKVSASVSSMICFNITNHYKKCVHPRQASVKNLQFLKLLEFRLSINKFGSKQISY